MSGLVNDSVFAGLLVSPDNGRTLAVMEGATLLAAEVLPIVSGGIVACGEVVPSPLVCV
jgi:hypothetical protein